MPRRSSAWKSGFCHSGCSKRMAISGRGVMEIGVGESRKVSAGSLLRPDAGVADDVPPFHYFRGELGLKLSRRAAGDLDPLRRELGAKVGQLEDRVRLAVEPRDDLGVPAGA